MGKIKYSSHLIMQQLSPHIQILCFLQTGISALSPIFWKWPAANGKLTNVNLRNLRWVMGLKFPFSFKWRNLSKVMTISISICDKCFPSLKAAEKNAIAFLTLDCHLLVLKKGWKNIWLWRLWIGSSSLYGEKVYPGRWTSLVYLKEQLVSNVLKVKLLTSMLLILLRS